MNDHPQPAPAADRGDAAVLAALAGLAALAVAMGIGRFAFTPLLPMMQDDAGVTVAQGGWLASANYAGYLVGALTAGALRVRATAAIRGGLLAIGVTTLAMGLTRDFTAWILLRTAAGIGSAWVLIHVSAWSLQRLAASGRPHLSGVVFAGVGSGITFAGLLCLLMMRAGTGSATAWIVFGLCALLLCALLWLPFRSRADAASVATGYTLSGALFTGAAAPRLILAYGTYGFGYIIPATFLPLMASQIVQDPEVFGWSWPAFGAAAMLSTLVAASLPAFIDPRRLWLASQLVLAAGVALPVLHPGIGGIMVSALLVGGTFVVITMAAVQEARLAAGQHATALIAAMTSAFALGQIVGPLLAGWTAGADGDFSRALVIASALLVVGAGALWRRPRATTASERQIKETCR